LVLAANIYESWAFKSHEGKNQKFIHRDMDLVDMKFEDLDEMDLIVGGHPAKGSVNPQPSPGIGIADFKYGSDEIHNDDKLLDSR
jgi:hypothetical protein